MFLGEYSHALDAKNRIFIPAKYREELGETFVITKSIDKCLTVYTMAEWENAVVEEYADIITYTAGIVAA